MCLYLVDGNLYDSTTGRYISANWEIIDNATLGLLDYNLFAYSKNNPVKNKTNKSSSLAEYAVESINIPNDTILKTTQSTIYNVGAAKPYMYMNSNACN